MNDHHRGGVTPAGVDPDERQDAAAEPDAGAVDDAAREREDRVAQVERERDEHYDRLLRVTAEFDNFRKRTERERRDISDRAVASLLEELLPIVDDFERALNAEAGSVDAAYREGVAIIHRQLTDLLQRRGVRPIDAVGAEFDPRVHQAVTYEAVPGHRDGEVVEELRRGYTLGDRLLRPSMVKVAKA
jgi:molecular chaperone GrpE